MTPADGVPVDGRFEAKAEVASFTQILGLRCQHKRLAPSRLYAALSLVALWSSRLNFASCHSVECGHPQSSQLQPQHFLP